MRNLHVCVAGCFLALTTLNMRGQLSGAIGVEVGQESTQFGDTSNSDYTYAKRTTLIFDLAPQLILGGNVSRNQGWDITAGADVRFPSDTSNATGNPTEYAGNVSFDWRLYFMGLGGGVEGREFVLPSDPTYARPNQFLVGVPFHYKVTFGPHSAAYVQAAATIWVLNENQDSSSSNTSTITLSQYSTSYDFKVTGGYVFGSKHLALKATYLRRDVPFTVGAPGSASAAIRRPPASPNVLAGTNSDYAGMNFTQNAITGGLAWVF